MLKIPQKLIFSAALGLSFALSATATFANDVEVRSLDELQKEIEIIMQSPAIQKALNHKEVQKALVQINAHIEALENQAKFEAEKALNNKKEAAKNITQERWDMTVGKLIDDYKKSDIPRKLEQGNWSALEETKALLHALKPEESFTEKQSGSLDFREKK